MEGLLTNPQGHSFPCWLSVPPAQTQGSTKPPCAEPAPPRCPQISQTTSSPFPGLLRPLLRARHCWEKGLKEGRLRAIHLQSRGVADRQRKPGELCQPSRDGQE